MTQEHFKKLFDLYFEEVRRYIYYRSGNADLADDITQSSFLKIWEKKMKVLPGKERALIYKIAGDEFISAYRKKQSEFKFQNNTIEREQVSSPEEELEYKELNQHFLSVLDSMKEKQRVVFLLSRTEGLKYSEIAQRLGISVKAIEKRMNGALQLLNRELRPK